MAVLHGSGVTKGGREGRDSGRDAPGVAGKGAQMSSSKYFMTKDHKHELAFFDM